MAASPAGNRFVSAVTALADSVLCVTRLLAELLLLPLGGLRAAGSRVPDAAGAAANGARTTLRHRLQRADRNGPGVAAEIEELGAAIMRLEDLAPHAYDVRRRWVAGDTKRAKQFGTWIGESTDVALGEQRWRALAAQWSKYGAAGAGKPEPSSRDEEARLAAQLIGQIELGWMELRELQQRLGSEDGSLERTRVHEPERDSPQRHPAREWLGPALTGIGERFGDAPLVRVFVGAAALTALAYLSVAPGTLAPAVGLPLLVLLLAVSIDEALVYLRRPWQELQTPLQARVAERLAPYLEAQGADEELDAARPAAEREHPPATPPNRGAPSLSVSWLAFALLALGLALSVDVAYSRWSEAGSLDAAGLMSVLAVIYAGVFATRAIGRRVARGWPRIGGGISFLGGVAALAAVVAVAAAEMGRYDDARALDDSGFVIVAAPASPSFFARSLRLPVSWRTGAAVAVDGFDVRVRAARPSRPLGRSRIWLADTSRRRSLWVGAPGHTYCFSARAHAQRYGSSPWSRLRCAAVPLDDRAFSRRGRWSSERRSAYLLATTSRSSTQGSALVRRVRARRLALVARRCPSCGTVAVYLGRRLLKRVSLEGPLRPSQVIRIRRWLLAKRGLLRLVVVSEGKPVVIDGVGTSLRR